MRRKGDAWRGMWPAFFVLALCTLWATACAQEAAPEAAQATSPAGVSVMGDLVAAIAEVEEKLVGLSRAIPAEQFGWRPAEGVRSVGEVVMHVAADNYLLPAGAGVAPPAATGINAEDYATVQAYERNVPEKDAAIAAMEASFAHLESAMSGSPDARLGETISIFGQSMTVQKLWVLTTTHLHEHLGQLIAYARSNGVVPPWSQ